MIPYHEFDHSTKVHLYCVWKKKCENAIIITLMVLMLILGVLLGLLSSYLLSRSNTLPCWPEVEHIIKEIHEERPYVEGEYTCTNFTQRAVDVLREKGIEAYYTRWDNTENASGPGHATVKVCRDYDVTWGTDGIDVRFVNQSILDYSNGIFNGVYCPWLEEEQYCDFFLERCTDSGELRLINYTYNKAYIWSFNQSKEIQQKK